MCLFYLFIQSTLNSHLLCSRHCSKCFIHTHSFNLYNNPRENWPESSLLQVTPWEQADGDSDPGGVAPECELLYQRRVAVRWFVEGNWRKRIPCSGERCWIGMRHSLSRKGGNSLLSCWLHPVLESPSLFCCAHMSTVVTEEALGSLKNQKGNILRRKCFLEAEGERGSPGKKLVFGWAGLG